MLSKHHNKTKQEDPKRYKCSSFTSPRTPRAVCAAAAPIASLEPGGGLSGGCWLALVVAGLWLMSPQQKELFVWDGGGGGAGPASGAGTGGAALTSES